MVSWLGKQRHSPIGVDIGSRSVKLVQLSADRSQLVEASRWDFPNDDLAKLTPAQRTQRFAEALRRAREGRNFRGTDAVLCLNDRQLFVQNVRVPKSESPQMDRLVQQEAAGRVPFAVQEAEIRYIDAADVRQGDAMLREVIVLACHRPVLEETLEAVEAAGLRPRAVDVEPAALLRGSVKQFRRDEDQLQRMLVVNIGHAKTAVVIAQGDDVLFVKFIEIGGKHFDEAVARYLKMNQPDATALRRHNGDRRSDQQDAEIARSVSDAVRPVAERLLGEISMCVRYHSVTFRGQPLVRLLLGGGEATPQLAETFGARLNLRCELSDPLRGFSTSPPAGRRGQWDVATGLALRELNQ
jgi:type IV pilus assembly protein PilM